MDYRARLSSGRLVVWWLGFGSWRGWRAIGMRRRPHGRDDKRVVERFSCFYRQHGERRRDQQATVAAAADGRTRGREDARVDMVVLYGRAAMDVVGRGWYTGVAAVDSTVSTLLDTMTGSYFTGSRDATMGYSVPYKRQVTRAYCTTCHSTGPHIRWYSVPRERTSAKRPWMTPVGKNGSGADGGRRQAMVASVVSDGTSDSSALALALAMGT